MKFLQWLKSLFGGSQNPSETNGIEQQKTVDLDESRLTGETNTGITYRPSLVQELKGDHQNLLGLYTLVLESIEKTEYSKISGQLEVFKSEFNAHLNTENVKFYGYLEKSLKESEGDDNVKQIRTFRREMNSIANAVNKFLNQWIDEGVEAATVAEFTESLKGIGAALVRRIESEENNLYPIYDQYK